MSPKAAAVNLDGEPQARHLIVRASGEIERIRLIVCIERRDALTQRVQCRLCAVCQMELAQNVADVCPYSAFANDQFVRDVLIRPAVRDRSQNLQLACGKRISCQRRFRWLVDLLQHTLGD